MQEEFFDSTEGQGGGSIALFLGLYLLILAFFILLVSISTLEDEKTQAAVTSVTTSFAKVLPPELQLKVDSEVAGEVLAGQHFQDSINDIFTSSIQITKAEVTQVGKQMVIQLDSDALFETGSDAVRKTNHPLLDRVVATLSGSPPGLRFDMEFVIGSPYQKGKILPIGETLEMQRAGSFVREMMGRGVPPGNIAVGITPGNPKNVSIWFYVRKSGEGIVTFTPAEGKKGE